MLNMRKLLSPSSFIRRVLLLFFSALAPAVTTLLLLTAATNHHQFAAAFDFNAQFPFDIYNQNFGLGEILKVRGYVNKPPGQLCENYLGPDIIAGTFDIDIKLGDGCSLHILKSKMNYVLVRGSLGKGSRLIINNNTVERGYSQQLPVYVNMTTNGDNELVVQHNFVNTISYYEELPEAVLFASVSNASRPKNDPDTGFKLVRFEGNGIYPFRLSWAYKVLRLNFDSPMSGDLLVYNNNISAIGLSPFPVDQHLLAIDLVRNPTGLIDVRGNYFSVERVIGAVATFFGEVTADRITFEQNTIRYVAPTTGGQVDDANATVLLSKGPIRNVVDFTINDNTANFPSKKGCAGAILRGLTNLTKISVSQFTLTCEADTEKIHALVFGGYTDPNGKRNDPVLPSVRDIEIDGNDFRLIPKTDQVTVAAFQFEDFKSHETDPKLMSNIRITMTNRVIVAGASSIKRVTQVAFGGDAPESTYGTLYIDRLQQTLTSVPTDGTSYISFTGNGVTKFFGSFDLKDQLFFFNGDIKRFAFIDLPSETASCIFRNASITNNNFYTPQRASESIGLIDGVGSLGCDGTCVFSNNKIETPGDQNAALFFARFISSGKSKSSLTGNGTFIFESNTVSTTGKVKNATFLETASPISTRKIKILRNNFVNKRIETTSSFVSLSSARGKAALPTPKSYGSPFLTSIEIQHNTIDMATPNSLTAETRAFQMRDLGAGSDAFVDFSNNDITVSSAEVARAVSVVLHKSFTNKRTITLNVANNTARISTLVPNAETNTAFFEIGATAQTKFKVLRNDVTIMTQVGIANFVILRECTAPEPTLRGSSNANASIVGWNKVQVTSTNRFSLFTVAGPKFHGATNVTANTVTGNSILRSFAILNLGRVPTDDPARLATDTVESDSLSRLNIERNAIVVNTAAPTYFLRLAVVRFTAAKYTFTHDTDPVDTNPRFNVKKNTIDVPTINYNGNATIFCLFCDNVDYVQNGANQIDEWVFEGNNITSTTSPVHVMSLIAIPQGENNGTQYPSPKFVGATQYDNKKKINVCVGCHSKMVFSANHFKPNPDFWPDRLPFQSFVLGRTDGKLISVKDCFWQVYGGTCNVVHRVEMETSENLWVRWFDNAFINYETLQIYRHCGSFTWTMSHTKSPTPDTSMSFTESQPLTETVTHDLTPSRELTPTADDSISKSGSLSLTYELTPSKEVTLTTTETFPSPTADETVSVSGPSDTKTLTYQTDSESYTPNSTVSDSPTPDETATADTRSKNTRTKSTSMSISETQPLPQFPPLPGLPEWFREVMDMSSKIVTAVAAAFASPTLALAGSRGLAVFALVGCREYDDAGTLMIERILSFPTNLWGPTSAGVITGQGARMAVISWVVIYTVALLIVFGYTYYQVDKRMKAEADAEIDKKHEQRLLKEQQQQQQGGGGGLGYNSYAGEMDDDVDDDEWNLELKLAQRRSRIWKVVYEEAPLPKTVGVLITMTGGIFAAVCGLLAATGNVGDIFLACLPYLVCLVCIVYHLIKSHKILKSINGPRLYETGVFFNRRAPQKFVNIMRSFAGQYFLFGKYVWIPWYRPPLDEETHKPSASEEKETAAVAGGGGGAGGSESRSVSASATSSHHHHHPSHTSAASSSSQAHSSSVTASSSRHQHQQSHNDDVPSSVASTSATSSATTQQKSTRPPVEDINHAIGEKMLAHSGGTLTRLWGPHILQKPPSKKREGGGDDADEQQDDDDDESRQDGTDRSSRQQDTDGGDTMSAASSARTSSSSYRTGATSASSRRLRGNRSSTARTTDRSSESAAEMDTMTDFYSSVGSNLAKTVTESDIASTVDTRSLHIRTWNHRSVSERGAPHGYDDDGNSVYSSTDYGTTLASSSSAATSTRSRPVDEYGEYIDDDDSSVLNSSVDGTGPSSSSRRHHNRHQHRSVSQQQHDDDDYSSRSVSHQSSYDPSSHRSVSEVGAHHHHHHHHQHGKSKKGKDDKNKKNKNDKNSKLLAAAPRKTDGNRFHRGAIDSRAVSLAGSSVAPSSVPTTSSSRAGAASSPPRHVIAQSVKKIDPKRLAELQKKYPNGKIPQHLLAEPSYSSSRSSSAAANRKHTNNQNVQQGEQEFDEEDEEYEEVEEVEEVEEIPEEDEEYEYEEVEEEEQDDGEDAQQAKSSSPPAAAAAAAAVRGPTYGADDDDYFDEEEEAYEEEEEDGEHPSATGANSTSSQSHRRRHHDDEDEETESDDDDEEEEEEDEEEEEEDDEDEDDDTDTATSLSGTTMTSSSSLLTGTTNATTATNTTAARSSSKRARRSRRHADIDPDDSVSNVTGPTSTSIVASSSSSAATGTTATNQRGHGRRRHSAKKNKHHDGESVTNTEVSSVAPSGTVATDTDVERRKRKQKKNSKKNKKAVMLAADDDGASGTAGQQKQSSKKTKKTAVVRRRRSRLGKLDDDDDLEEDNELSAEERLDETGWYRSGEIIALRWLFCANYVWFMAIWALVVGFICGIGLGLHSMCPFILFICVIFNSISFIFTAWLRPYLVPFHNLVIGTIELTIMGGTIMAAFVLPPPPRPTWDGVPPETASDTMIQMFTICQLLLTCAAILGAILLVACRITEIVIRRSTRGKAEIVPKDELLEKFVAELNNIQFFSGDDEVNMGDPDDLTCHLLSMPDPDPEAEEMKEMLTPADAGGGKKKKGGDKNTKEGDNKRSSSSTSKSTAAAAGEKSSAASSRSPSQGGAASSAIAPEEKPSSSRRRGGGKHGKSSGSARNFFFDELSSVASSRHSASRSGGRHQHQHQHQQPSNNQHNAHHHYQYNPPSAIEQLALTSAIHRPQQQPGGAVAQPPFGAAAGSPLAVSGARPSRPSSSVGSIVPSSSPPRPTPAAAAAAAAASPSPSPKASSPNKNKNLRGGVDDKKRVKFNEMFY